MESQIKNLKEKIKSVIEKAGIEVAHDGLEVLDSGNVSGYITSTSFENIDDSERQTMIWDALKKNLMQEELIHISGIMAMTPQELTDLD